MLFGMHEYEGLTQEDVERRSWKGKRKDTREHCHGNPKKRGS
jgi:hypothetical protein